MCIESVMPCNYLILCRSLLLLPSILPSIRVFSNESALRMRWPKYWNFSFNISPSNEILNESKRLLNRVPLSLAFQRMCLIFQFMLGQGCGRKLRSAVWLKAAAAAAAKSLQSCLTLCNPIDGSPPSFPVPGILQARTLEWVAISFSSACK